MNHHEKPYSWYIHPPALVRCRMAQYVDCCTLCIGPTSFRYSDPEWSAIAPVVTEVSSPACKGKAIVDWMIQDLLQKEADQIRKQFNLDHYGKFKTILTIPEV